MMVDIDILEEARKVFAIEIESLQKVKDELDEDFTVLVSEILTCQGRVINPGISLKRLRLPCPVWVLPLIFCIRPKAPMVI